jgi:hypothetical protein
MPPGADMTKFEIFPPPLLPQVSKYEKLARAALPAMLQAEKDGARCARHFTIFLNSANVAAPAGKKWTEGGYLKARWHLFNRRLANPPLDHHAARDNCLGHDARRAAMDEKMKLAGEAYVAKSTAATEFEALTLLAKLKTGH